MDTDFSLRPLVAGTINGLRAFEVDRLGRLHAPQHSKYIFKPGENAANCLYESVDHKIANGRCSCGFYAYHDGSNTYHSRSNGTIAGMIEGYGTVTVGTKGFRAEKCKIIAILDRHKSIWGRLQWLSYVWIGALLAALGIALGLSESGYTFAIWSMFFIPLGLAVLGTLATGLGCFIDDENFLNQFYISPTAKRRLLRRNYPDVPTYATKRAMLRAHPLTTPPEYDPNITPETENFWEMAL